MVVGAVDSFAVIETYPEDKYLPSYLKLGDHSVLIIKDVPVLQCHSCHAYLLRDPVMAQVDALLESANHAAELAVVRYAA